MASSVIGSSLEPRRLGGEREIGGHFAVAISVAHSALDAGPFAERWLALEVFLGQLSRAGAALPAVATWAGKATEGL
jgi:hypothetical protein